MLEEGGNSGLLCSTFVLRDGMDCEGSAVTSKLLKIIASMEIERNLYLDRHLVVSPNNLVEARGYAPTFSSVV